MESSSYLRSISRYWWLVLIPATAAAIVALAISAISPRRYQATATFIISPNSEVFTSQNEVINSINSLDRRSTIATFAEVLNSQRILGETATALHLDSEALAAYELSSAVLPEASVVELTVTGPDRQNAITLANTVGNNAIDYTNELYSVYRVHFLDEPFASEQPVSPNPARDAIVAFVIGGGLGSILALGLDSRRNPPASARRATPVVSDGRETSPVVPWTRFEQHLQRTASERPGNALSLAVVRLDALQDQLLRQPQNRIQRSVLNIAEVMQAELLPRDVIGQMDQTTLAVLLPGISGQAALRIFRRVQQRLANPNLYSQAGEPVLGQATIGIAEHGEKMDSQELLRRAYLALDRAPQSEGLVALLEPDERDAAPSQSATTMKPRKTISAE